MIQFIDRYFESSDDRGAIEGLINFGSWEELNYITSDSRMVRGNHYHKRTREAFIILSGRITVTVQKVTNGQFTGEEQSYEMTERQVFVIEPMVNHIFVIEEKSIWINLLSHRMDQEKPDFHRV